MLLTISTTHEPATDLGFLLQKHPDRVRSVSVPFGEAHVFFPEASEARCTAALLVEVDPIGLVRRPGRGAEGFSLAGYVNDRPYAASSFLSVALGKVFRTALNGRSADRQELADTALPFVVELPTVPCRGGEAVLRELFEPLGYVVEAAPIALDQRFPEWGDSRYLSVRLTGEVRMADLLAHLYVLLPVLDDEKHYWVGDDEADKLLAKGEAWLGAHPARDLITRRYLKHRRSLAAMVLDQLADEDTPVDVDQDETHEDAAAEKPWSLNRQRLDAVVAVITGAGAGAGGGAQRVIDLGCGEGRLVQALLEAGVAHVTGVDVSARVLERAEARLRLDRLSERQADRVALLHGGLTYRDARFAGFDAAALVEVIEHLDEARLGALEQVVFAHARPGMVVVTTPNVEHNVRFEGMAAGQLRHRDHRFEWTRAQFVAWAERVAGEHDYTVRFEPIGASDPEVGAPTQMAVFNR